MRKGSPTYNPVRRNRKIGTSDQGLKKRNRFDIPEPWHSNELIFWERLRDPVAISCEIGSHQFWILVEPTLVDFRHYVTPGDILTLFREIPEADRAEIKSVVLRQPTRKQDIFSPVWGRMGYWADLGKYSGPAIMLEAMQLDKVIVWSKSLTPDYKRELDLLESEGHELIAGKRDITIVPSAKSIRQTQLFRTLAHEIGHHVHLETWDSEIDYWSLPRVEKESFADKYATEFTSRLAEAGKVPFEPVCIRPDEYDGVDPAWFWFHEM